MKIRFLVFLTDWLRKEKKKDKIFDYEWVIGHYIICSSELEKDLDKILIFDLNMTMEVHKGIEYFVIPISSKNLGMNCDEDKLKDIDYVLKEYSNKSEKELMKLISEILGIDSKYKVEHFHEKINF